jgi:CTP synthase
VRELTSLGIQPDILLCRCEHPLPEMARQDCPLLQRAQGSGDPPLDAPNIYAVPIQYHNEGLDAAVLHHFGLTAPRPI